MGAIAVTMRPPVRILAIASWVVVLLSCSDAGPTPPSPSKPGDPPPSLPPTTATLLIISPDTVVVTQDDTVGLGAALVMSDGRRLPTTARWTSSDTLVVAMRFGSAIGMAPGKAIITAATDSPPLHAQVPAVVLAKPAATAPRALVVQRFVMMEFQYPSAPDSWFYAPQIQATAAPGRSVFISHLIFSIPGLDDPIPAWACDAYLSAGTVVELNGEVYGDWAMSLTGGSRQATGADATARITYTDDSGVTSTLTLHGPIVHGSLPTTYSSGGGGMGGACFHGYGSG